MTKDLYVVIPLASGVSETWTEPGPNFQKRCEQVSEIVHSLRAQGCDVLIMQGAGKPERRRDAPTLATLNAKYLQSLQLGVPIEANQVDPERWGSLEEIYWILQEIQEHYSVSDLQIHLIFVTQRRHLWRVRVIAFCVVPRRYTTHFVTSGQTKEIALAHECRGYAALLLTLIGLRGPVRWIRRRVSLAVDRL